jgi:hypothetical protein
VVFGRVDEVHRAKNITVVGHGHGGHAHFLYPLAELFDITGAVEQGVVGVQVQVNELGHGLGKASLPQWERRKNIRFCGFRVLEHTAGVSMSAIDFVTVNL